MAASRRLILASFHLDSVNMDSSTCSTIETLSIEFHNWSSRFQPLCLKTMTSRVFPDTDVLAGLSPGVDFESILRLRIESDAQVDRRALGQLAAIIKSLPTCDSALNPSASAVNPTEPAAKVEIDQGKICIGSYGDLKNDQHVLLEKAIESLRPWRKGPFKLFDHEIDAEWQANLKWNRIAPALGNLHGRKILDVGCDNGYYMFRAAKDDAKAVIGFDPSIYCQSKFNFLQRYLQFPNVQFERLGHEHLFVFDRTFDIALCMGVLYHHPGPVEVLRRVKNTIRVGGFAVIECQTIPGEGSHAICPPDRYAQSPQCLFCPNQRLSCELDSQIRI